MSVISGKQVWLSLKTTCSLRNVCREKAKLHRQTKIRHKEAWYLIRESKLPRQSTGTSTQSCSQTEIQITLWKCFSLFFDHTRNTGWLGSHLRHLIQVPDLWGVSLGQKKEVRKGLSIFLPLLSEAWKFSNKDRCQGYRLGHSPQKLQSCFNPVSGHLVWTEWVDHKIK